MMGDVDVDVDVDDVADDDDDDDDDHCCIFFAWCLRDYVCFAFNAMLIWSLDGLIGWFSLEISLGL